MKNKTMRKSWRKTVLILLTTLFLCSTLTLLTTSVYYLKQAKQTIDNEHNYICEKWGNSVDIRLTLVYEQIKDLLVSTYNNTEFAKSVDTIDPYSAQKIAYALQNKIISSNDISSIFLYDINSDYYIYYSNNKSSTVKSPMMKSYLKEECQKAYDFLSDARWGIRQIGGRFYFYKSSKLGRFIVGAVSDCAQYGLSANGLSCFFINNNSYVYCCGDENALDGVSIENISSYRNSRKMISSFDNDNSKIKVVLVGIRQLTNISIIISSLFLANSLLSVFLILVLFQYMNKRIVVPTKELIKATTEVSKGNINYLIDVDKAGSEEFEELYVKFNNMTQQIEDLKIESYDMKLNEEKNRLKMLRAQVRPHTFLNGITTISNLTYDDNPEKVREYIYSFSQFVRYMLHTDSEWVSIIEEIEHIKNYVQMQKMRFPDSIDFTYSCDEKIENEQVPFLLMFSLVENSCKHVMDMVKTLNIRVDCRKYEEENFKGILITVEDDGDGFPESVLDKYNEGEINTKEHLGLSNIRYTLHLLYKRNGLLRLSNKKSGGAKVEMLIPERRD